MSLKIPFGIRSINYNKKEIKTILSVLKKKSTLTQGVYLKKFEKEFSKYIGSKNCFAVNSATSAIEIVAKLCQLNKGDEVVIPAHTYTSSAYPFVKNNASIKWSDIDLTTRVTNIKYIKRVVTKKTKVIVVPHLYGFAVDIVPILKFAKKRKIIVVEDCAQALGVEFNGKKVGTFGDFAVFSFHSHKNITTMGEGGVIVSKSNKYNKIIPMIRHNGHSKFTGSQKHYWLPAMTNVDLPKINNQIIMPGNYCIDEVKCALGIELLKRIDQINKSKRNRAISFIDNFKSYKKIRFHRINSKRHNYYLLVAEIFNNKRDYFIEQMFNKYGIQCVIQYYPLYKYDFYIKTKNNISQCPNTEMFYNNMVSIPFSSVLTAAQVAYIMSSCAKVLKSI